MNILRCTPLIQKTLVSCRVAMFYLKPTVWEQAVRMSGLKSWNSRTLWCFVCMACFKHRNLDPPDQTYFSHWRMATARNSWPPKVAGSMRNISNDAPFLVGPKGQPFLGTSPHNPIVCSSFSLCNLPQIGAKSWRIPWHVAISKPHSQWKTPQAYTCWQMYERQPTGETEKPWRCLMDGFGRE